jgi:hypothetical protein
MSVDAMSAPSALGPVEEAGLAMPPGVWIGWSPLSGSLLNLSFSNTCTFTPLADKPKITATDVPDREGPPKMV